MSDDSYEAIRDLATSMYRAENPRGVWEAEDEATRVYWMKRAALRGRLTDEQTRPE